MKSISLVIVAALLSSACASTVIGTQPSATPPQLVAVAGGIAWDKPGAFGPLPPAMAAKGAAKCAMLNTATQTYRALGYHPYAKDMDGKPIPEGGFYCVPN